MERRRSPSRVLPRSGLSKSSRSGRRAIPTPAANSKAAHSPRTRVPSKRGITPGPSQSLVPSSNLQQHYAFSFQITTDQKENRLSQAAIEKATCTSCEMFAAGRTVIGGVVCEESIPTFIIQNQLSRLPPVDRNKNDSAEGLNRAPYYSPRTHQ